MILTEFKKINSKINDLLEYQSNRLKSIENTGDVEISNNRIFDFVNNETICEILSIDELKKSNALYNETFKRIICIKGKIKVSIFKYDEETFLSPPNTILIPPKTFHTIETIENSEIIVIYKNDEPIVENDEITISEINTIYK